MTYDIFPFFNELDILEIRLGELSAAVDRFIAVQSVETHSGLPKPIYLDPRDDRWKPWANRLETVILPAIPDAKDRWVREHATRHVIPSLLLNAKDDDIVFMSDVDEFPTADHIVDWSEQLNGDDAWVGFLAPCHYYYLNLRTPTLFHCMALAHAKTVRKLGGQAFRNARKHPPIGPVPGGWHLSYMGGVEAIRAKLAAFAHEEWDTPEMKDPVFLATCLATKQNLFRKKERFTQVPLTHLPYAVQDRPERYAHLLLSEDTP